MIDTQASGVDAFVSDMDTPSAALLQIQESESEDVRTEILLNYTEEAEDPVENMAWGKKLNGFGCGDGLNAHCGGWRIEIKRDTRDEERDVEENISVERESSDKKMNERESISDDGIRVTAMDALSTEEQEAEVVEAADVAAEKTWLDHISDQAQNMRTTLAGVASPAINALRNISADMSPTNQDEEAEVIKVSNLTEMALNGDQEDAYIAKEVIGHIKQVEHEKEFSIVEDAKKLMPQVKSAMDPVAVRAKGTWSFLSQKITSLTIKTVDHISDKAQNVCTKLSCVTSSAINACSARTSSAINSLRNISADRNSTNQDEEAEAIKVSNLTEMALNGDSEDTYIQKEGKAL